MEVAGAVKPSADNATPKGKRLRAPNFLRELRGSPEATVAAIGIIATLLTAGLGAAVAIVVSRDAINAQNVMYRRQQRDAVFDAFDDRQTAFDRAVDEAETAAARPAEYSRSEEDDILQRLDTAYLALSDKRWRIYEYASPDTVTIINRMSQNAYDLTNAEFMYNQDSEDRRTPRLNVRTLIDVRQTLKAELYSSIFRGDDT